VRESEDERQIAVVKGLDELRGMVRDSVMQVLGATEKQGDMVALVVLTKFADSETLQIATTHDGVPR
jgi:hypothetical protein